jgi:long-subunit acyl-CoA synthetase (AMP-forming)
VRIAGDSDQELPENHIGHILIAGDNVTKGYFENPEANAKGFTADGWLRTGDLGMMKGGKLFITGRAKEIIFVNGQNYYPHDIESIAIRADNLELGKVVAAGVRRQRREHRRSHSLRAASDGHEGILTRGKHGDAPRE